MSFLGSTIRSRLCKAFGAIVLFALARAVFFSWKLPHVQGEVGRMASPGS